MSDINEYYKKECFFLSMVNNGESIYQDNKNHSLIRRSFPKINDSLCKEKIKQDETYGEKQYAETKSSNPLDVIGKNTNKIEENEYSEIISDLNIIGSNLYDNKKINFNQNDIFIMNISSLISEGFNNLIDYNKSDIVSVLINSLKETTDFIIHIFKNFMIYNNKIRIICFSKRNNNTKQDDRFSSKDKKFSYLTKIFFEKNSKEYMSNVFKCYLNKYEFKLKIDDLNKNSNDITERGIKKNNWKNINSELNTYDL